MTRYGRRTAIASGLGLILGATVTRLVAGSPDGIDPEKGVTAPEDLMKEHGVLNRCLLIYEEAVRRLQEKQEVAAEVFSSTAELVKKFVEEYHEKNEETFIFPKFEQAKKEVDLVHTLLEQHRAGRVVTGEIIQLSRPAAFGSRDNRERLIAGCHSFIRMYRPHEAREDTVLFPALRTILTPKKVEELGDRMEEQEQMILGKEGFEKSLEQVTEIEKKLGIYDLARFTPR